MARRGIMAKEPTLRGQARKDFRAQKAAQQAQPVPAPQQPMAPAPVAAPSNYQPANFNNLIGQYTQAAGAGPRPEGIVAPGSKNGGMVQPKPNPREQWLQQQQQQWRSQELTPEEANMTVPVGGGFMGNPNYYGGQGQSPMTSFQQMPPDKMLRFPQPIGQPQLDNMQNAITADYRMQVMPDQPMPPNPSLVAAKQAQQQQFNMAQQPFQRMPMPMRRPQ
jgi:hypothetical protein